jgi:hypothetical protein
MAALQGPDAGRRRAEAARLQAIQKQPANIDWKTDWNALPPQRLGGRVKALKT